MNKLLTIIRHLIKLILSYVSWQVNIKQIDKTAQCFIYIAVFMLFLSAIL